MFLDMPFLSLLKEFRVINEHILVDIMSRPNRPQRVLCLCENLLELGPHALHMSGVALVKCGYKGLASVLQHLLLEERERAWSQPTLNLTKWQ